MCNNVGGKVKTAQFRWAAAGQAGLALPGLKRKAAPIDANPKKSCTDILQRDFVSAFPSLVILSFCSIRDREDEGCDGCCVLNALCCRDQRCRGHVEGIFKLCIQDTTFQPYRPRSYNLDSPYMRPIRIYSSLERVCSCISPYDERH